MENVDFPSALTFLFVCVFGCVYLQVVGMDADQRPLSRRGPAGEGQGSQPGGPEGPESRLGSTKGLGRKLSGEYSTVICLSLVFSFKHINTATENGFFLPI